MHWNQSAGKGGVKNESWSVQNPPLLVFQSVYGTMLSTLSHQIPVERCQSSSCCIPFPETCPESRRPGLLPLQCHFTGISLDLTGDGPAATQKHTWFWIIRAVYATMVGSMPSACCGGVASGSFCTAVWSHGFACYFVPNLHVVEYTLN